jgi:membrane fusion protein, multidrug efflux system
MASLSRVVIIGAAVAPTSIVEAISLLAFACSPSPSKRPIMSAQSHLIWLLALVLLSVSRAAHGGDIPAKAPEVTVARPVVREVTDHEDFAGRIEASARVDLRPRVAGYLVSSRFKEGLLVNQGDVLFEIDPRPYEAQLKQALSQVDLNQATLRLARNTLARDHALAKRVPGSVSNQQLDQNQAAADEALARVKASEASADICKLNLSFCRVTAPIGGRIGRRLVDPGNMVYQDQTLLAVLVSEEPMYVSFDSDERTYLRLRRSMPAGELQTRKLPVAIGLADEDGFPHRGVLDFGANRVDPDTGAISLRATLANNDHLLVPGMFVRVRLTLGAAYKALLVSDRAIASDQARKFVYVVDPENKVRYRQVKSGPLQSDGLRVITEGLKPDDRVIVGRLTGLRPGMAVRPSEADATAPKLPPPGDELPSARGSSSGVRVETSYAGANAQMVSDVVRSPIEQQVSGLEKIRYIRSRCTSDGKYALDITFAPGVDSWRSQTLVQNRVALAMPLLPVEVREGGVNVRSRTSGMVLIVTLMSQDQKYDRLYLGNYANIHLKDELARVAGVGEVDLVGASDFGLRVWLDTDRLAALSVSAADVIRVLRKEQREGAGDQDRVADLIVKTDGEGRVVRLRDVASVDLGACGPRSEAFLDGKPAVALCVHLTGDAAPSQVRDALQARLREIRGRMPDGLLLDVSFDFTANLEARERSARADYVLLDLDFAATSTERIGEVLEESATLVRQLPAVKHVLALSANPFDPFGGRPCLLVLLNPGQQAKSDRAEAFQAIRKSLGTLKEVTARLRDLSAPGCFPRCGYPIDFALHGPHAAEVREWADKLADRLRENKFADVWANPDSAPRRTRYMDINREMAAARGVALADVFSTIKVYAGPLPVTHFNRFGRVLRVEVQAGARAADWASGLGKLKVRNAKGQMLALSSFVTVREVEMPRALEFLDLCPMVELAANTDPGVPLEAGQKLCTMLADQVRMEMGLSAEYRLTWLQAIPRGK